MAALLAAAVVGLPLMLKDDGTAKGLTQILLTYTLSAVTTLLGLRHALALLRHAGQGRRGMPDAGGRGQTDRPLANLAGQMAGHSLAQRHACWRCPARPFLACLQWRASRLPADQQEILHKEIFVARASARRPPLDFRRRWTSIMQERVKRYPRLTGLQIAELRQQIAGQLNAEYTEVPPGYPAPVGQLTCTRCATVCATNRSNCASSSTPPIPIPDAQYTTVLGRRPDQLHRPSRPSTEKLPPDSFQEFHVPAQFARRPGRPLGRCRQPERHGPVVPDGGRV